MVSGDAGGSWRREESRRCRSSWRRSQRYGGNRRRSGGRDSHQAFAGAKWKRGRSGLTIDCSPWLNARVMPRGRALGRHRIARRGETWNRVAPTGRTWSPTDRAASLCGKHRLGGFMFIAANSSHSSLGDGGATGTAPQGDACCSPCRSATTVRATPSAERHDSTQSGSRLTWTFCRGQHANLLGVCAAATTGGRDRLRDMLSAGRRRWLGARGNERHDHL